MGMQEEAGRIEYHYGFYGAIRAEYESSGVEMEYLQEHELGDKPIRLDMLVIRQNVTPLADPIGSFFRIHNVLEYKSPEDGLTIDDFYKAQGYALIYKSLGKTVNAIPLEQMTVSIFRHAYPREMMNALKDSGMEIEERHPGVYTVTGSISVPTQVIVMSRLQKGEYEALKALAENADKEEILRLLGLIKESANSKIAEYVSAVLRVCIAVNKELFHEIKEEGVMTEAVESLFKEEFDQIRQETKDEVITNMLKANEPVDKIALYTQVSIDRIASVAKKIGIKSLML